MQKKNTKKTLSNLTGVGFFLDWEKLYQLPLGRERKREILHLPSASVRWVREFTCFAELYRQYKPRLEIDLTDDWEQRSSWERKDCCRNVTEELLSIGRYTFSTSINVFISFNFITKSWMDITKSCTVLERLLLGWVTQQMWILESSEVLCWHMGNSMFGRHQPRSTWTSWKNKTCCTVHTLLIGNLFF